MASALSAVGSLFKKVEDWNSSRISKDEDHIKKIIARDDRDEFFSFLNESVVINSGDSVILKFGKFESSPYKLLAWICHHRAILCATELVKAGKMGLEVDLNIPINGGAFPLHVAASTLSPALIELFLHHGALADVRCNAGDSEHNGLLPLHIALERVSSFTEWTPVNSIFKLIIILCLPKMKEALETSRLLALNTKKIKDVVRCYAKDGKLIELTVLLMVAREKVMDQITFQGIHLFTSTGHMTLRECVKHELAILICYEYKLMGRNEEKMLFQICKKFKAAMISIIQLLEIFETAGDAIETYLQSERTNAPKEQIVLEVSGLLKKLGSI
ncbi:uncharacterized protein LOC132276531 [Cornus florida]|uniref:uncharacterized protein LOC132276531 n=1 Tax=Cornus florida TaxID=4283 RepID=UPI0028963C11|nr:uncharacterized protein LOC132276531 [Cornus florida]XP_059633974.1 uncharacterized protein LOC132276531 [Cornus florida]